MTGAREDSENVPQAIARMAEAETSPFPPVWRPDIVDRALRQHTWRHIRRVALAVVILALLSFLLPAPGHAKAPADEFGRGPVVLL